MKEGWEYIALSSVCKVQNGFAFNSKLFNESNNGLPLIRIRDIKRGYSLTYTAEICSDEFFVEDGDMLIGMDGDFNIGEWKGGHALLNQRVCKLIPSEKIMAKFIFYFIPEALQRINDKTAFSTVKHLSSKQVNAILLPNLPLSEQQSIVDYLDSAFAKIDAMKANAEKALNEAKALFQASLKEMLEPKEGWEYKELGKVCDIVGGGTPDTKNKEYWRGHIPWATVSDMNCDIIKSTGYYITEKGLNESSSRIIKKGEIIIATRVGLGKVCKLAVDTAINQDLKGVIPKDNSILRDFIFYYFKHKAKYIVDNGIGATVKGVKIKFIEGLSFAFPSLSEQQSIVATLDSLKSKVDRLQENYEKISQECDALKQSILRQVFDYNNYFS